jgi:hypothetical protein
VIWRDPIGVYGEPDAQTEYDGYAGPLARMLREGASETDVFSYLQEAERDRITLAGNAELAAQKIVEWHEQVLWQLGHLHPRAA